VALLFTFNIIEERKSFNAEFGVILIIFVYTWVSIVSYKLQAPVHVCKWAGLTFKQIQWL
jgi:hypothetical protein